MSQAKSKLKIINNIYLLIMGRKMPTDSSLLQLKKTGI